MKNGLPVPRQLSDTRRAFTTLGASLLEARNSGVPLEMAVAKSAEWSRLEQTVATGAQLSNPLADVHCLCRTSSHKRHVGLPK